MQIKEYLADMIESPAYQRLVEKDATAAGEEIKSIIQSYQGMARFMLLRENDRIATIVQDTRAERRAAR